jgi:hypothetical protein
MTFYVQQLIYLFFFPFMEAPALGLRLLSFAAEQAHRDHGDGRDAPQ